MQMAIYIILAVLVILVFNTINILKEYERGVIFLLGRFWKVKGPGLILVIPLFQQMTRVQLRTVVLDVPSQDIITRDNVSVRVSAVVYFRIVDAEKSVIQIENYYEATSQLAQTTLRSVLGQHELDDLLAERDKLNKDLKSILDTAAENWGVQILNVEIKDVDINENMVRAIARQAEAERLRRAKVINAEGELQASQKLQEAAAVLAAQPVSIQLRYLQTLMDISSDKTTTVVFPLPMDFIANLQNKLK